MRRVLASLAASIMLSACSSSPSPAPPSSEVDKKIVLQQDCAMFDGPNSLNVTHMMLAGSIVYILPRDDQNDSALVREWVHDWVGWANQVCLGREHFGE